MDQSCYRFGTWFGGDLGFFPFTKLNINDMRRILRGSDSKSVGQNHHVADTKRSRTSQKEALEWHVESKNEISCVHFIYQSICLTPRPFSKKKRFLSQDKHVLCILQNVQAGIPWSLAQKTQHMQYGRCIWKHMR
jgi:hypothetical protein